MRELTSAVMKALEARAIPARVRRVAELTITLPEIMTKDEIDAWISDGSSRTGGVVRPEALSEVTAHYL